jgi:tRNA threonylcarbamoyladenosine biosynthesis protein TsaE
MFLEFALHEIESVAAQIISATKYKVVLFDGEMGAGKTTLIKEIAKQMGVAEPTGSPTYVLVNEYHTQNHQIIYHFDAYRLKDINEAYDMGFDEYLDSGSYCFIEWPERVTAILPEHYTTVTLKKISEEIRTVQVD